jgi:hypothetical protein
MGTFLSGAKARLTFTGCASGAADLLNSGFRHVHGEAVSLATEGTHG